MADRNSIIEKTKALLSKTTDNGCTEEEALTALAKARAWIDAYEISDDELQLSREEKAVLHDESEADARDNRCDRGRAPSLDCGISPAKRSLFRHEQVNRMSLESRRRKHAPFRRRGVARRDSSINQAPGDQTMTEGRSKDQDRIGIDDVCIDDQDRALNPIGRFLGITPCMRARPGWCSTSSAAAPSASCLAFGNRTPSVGL
jgi:hypothetical protein